MIMVSLSLLRRFSQIGFLALFLYFLYITQYPLDFAGTNLFLRASPLIMITNLIVTRSLVSLFMPAVLVLVITVIMGRVFCGWVCPIGTVSDVIPRTKRKFRSFFRVKYYILVFLIVLTFFGYQFLFFSDPIVIFTQSIVFITQVRIPLLFIGIIVLVAVVGERFWCRVICPLGALLGLFSFGKRVNVHIREDCTRCHACERVCPMDAIIDQHVRKTECTLCLRCIEACPQNAMGLSQTQERTTFEQRRTFLKAGVAAGAALLLSPLLGKTTPQSSVIRPPGALKEEKFLSTCMRCGECMKVCPSQGLRPVLFEGSLYAFYTPQLVPRIGECQLCMLCWQVCPTGALVEVDSSSMKIGTASVIRETCLEWNREKTCLVCVEVCPYQAVEVVSSGGKGKGSGNGRSGPQVNRSLCAGCGACEHNCPQEPTAIAVSPEGEIRY
jgi:NapH/MauN family ferredoxin-type protein/MauM/NapG family ferredoxin protein